MRVSWRDTVSGSVGKPHNRLVDQFASELRGGTSWRWLNRTYVDCRWFVSSIQCWRKLSSRDFRCFLSIRKRLLETDAER